MALDKCCGAPHLCGVICMSDEPSYDYLLGGRCQNCGVRIWLSNEGTWQDKDNYPMCIDGDNRHSPDGEPQWF
jgi:hypothetical protein